MKKILIESANGNLPDSMLVNINEPSGEKGSSQLNTLAASDFNRMVAAAKEDGVNLTVSQGYRHLGSQEEGCSKGFTQWCAWKKYKAGTGNVAAKPGTSNHGWGCAVDVKNCKSGSKVHKWLTENGKKFGFKQLPIESWHWDHESCAASMKSGASPSPDSKVTDTETTNSTTSTTTSGTTNSNLRNLFNNGDITKGSTTSNADLSDLGPLGMIIPLLKGMGFGTTSQVMNSIKSGEIPKEEIKYLIDTKTKKTSTNSGNLVSTLPSETQSAIRSLKSDYGIDITDDDIQKEIDMEGSWREDAGGEDSSAKKQIKLLIRDCEKKFPKVKGMGVVSGYRSYSDQVKNFGNKAKTRGKENTQKANTIPGFSQHHTGKAFDIFSVDTSWWNRNSDVKDWVNSNASNYGFKVTYTEGGKLRIPEPWHLYYTGGGKITENVDIKLTSELDKIKKIMLG